MKKETMTVALYRDDECNLTSIREIEKHEILVNIGLRRISEPKQVTFTLHVDAETASQQIDKIQKEIESIQIDSNERVKELQRIQKKLKVKI